MKGIIIITTLFASTGWLISQPVMEVEGAIKLGNFQDPNPELGTMRWTGSDFEIWNGVIWASLTGNKEVGTVMDIDNNTYKTIRIGSQVWMAENLSVTHYRNGVLIDQITNYETWAGLSTGAWCYYDNLSSNNIPYGKLYNWYAVDTDVLCPSGWHVPTEADLLTLIVQLGGLGIAGGKMKEEGFSHWRSPNSGATNESGFTGLPGGFRHPENEFDKSMGSLGAWWSSSESHTNYASILELSHSANQSTVPPGSKSLGLSVRCLKDQ
ncbi:MAG: fibrobacter succinogenes major paralogous domain-containing protein [Saprospiraceae bacterium]|nr:fibrobacter succinogenes major paralogous domain-containing protein [Saprospiraceae bacterium]